MKRRAGIEALEGMRYNRAGQCELRTVGLKVKQISRDGHDGKERGRAVAEMTGNRLSKEKTNSIEDCSIRP